MNRPGHCIALAYATLPFFLLSGCADPDSVLFVTKSSIGINFDAKPPAATVAYDRVEGYLGPRYDNGAVPPVVSSIQTDGNLVNPQIRQMYATGQAALNVVPKAPLNAAPKNPDTVEESEKPLSGGKRLMFFGTSTTTGLKIGFSTGYPDSFTFGYKRKEYSFIPLGTTIGADGKPVDVYPSVIASLDTRVRTTSPTESGLLTRQFFATGTSAERIAQIPEVQSAFRTEAKSSYEQYANAVREQEQFALGTLRCFTSIADNRLDLVWKDAGTRSILLGIQQAQRLKQTWDNAGKEKDPAKKQEILRAGRLRYAENVAITDGSSATRGADLKEHMDFVCGLSQADNN